MCNYIKKISRCIKKSLTKRRKKENGKTEFWKRNTSKDKSLSQRKTAQKKTSFGCKDYLAGNKQNQFVVDKENLDNIFLIVFVRRKRLIVKFLLSLKTVSK